MLFASTFFDNPNDVHYIKYAKGKDPLLRCYDVCDRYLADVKHNPNASADLKVYGDVAHSVSDVRAAFAACASGVTFPFISMRGNTS
ncbi:hypothetical protein PC111_g17216 [Phytophthora cactorum]|nr:hypothetical protein PC111_g17216 [Phytophthora cactorum]